MLLQQSLEKLQMADQDPMRVVVELVSSADVRRLEARDEELRQLIQEQDRRIEGLHRTIYELMETISKLRSKR